MTIIDFSIKNYFLYPSIVQNVDAHNMMYDNLVQETDNAQAIIIGH